jgi:hypothetical protein
MAGQTLEQFFAWAPWIIFAIIVFVAYVWTRGGSAPAHGGGQTYACSQCGRRGTRDQMVSVQHEGAVAWYCAHCAATAR